MFSVSIPSTGLLCDDVTATAMLAPPSGLIASRLTSDTPGRLGSITCPWSIRVDAHQRVNLTLIDFSSATTSSMMSSSDEPGDASLSSPAGCTEPYAYVAEVFAKTTGGGVDGTVENRVFVASGTGNSVVGTGNGAVTETGNDGGDVGSSGGGRGGVGERGVAGAGIICGGSRRRESVVYTSRSSSIDVWVNSLRYNSTPTQLQRYFLIRYEGKLPTYRHV